jgi:hypothetical protein
MAFGFFRRRQKMVIIIMVVLMLSFLLGGYGVSALFRNDPSGNRIADTRFGSMKLNRWWQAESDMEILRALGLGNPYRARQWPLEMAYLNLLNNREERQARYAYALLLMEAEEADVLVTEQDVDEFFQMYLGPDESAYRSLMSSLRDAQANWTEKSVRGAVANWLRIYRNYLAVRVNCPPSETELRVTFRDFAEQISLAVVRVKAEDFLDKIPDPNERDIKKQFETYKADSALRRVPPTEMRFGYRQPGKAAVQYLLINGEVVGRVAQPDFAEIEKYWRANKDDFFREEPVTPTTGPADANTPMKRVPLSFAEAKPEIVDKLHGQTVRDAVGQITGLVQKNVQTMLGGGDPATVYEKVVGMMTVPAEEILSTELKNLQIKDANLADAADRLALAANIPAICFPWGKHGDQELDPNVKVTITGDLTLRGALSEVCRQAKWPQLEWRRCQGMGNVLFSAEVDGQGIDFFPVQADATGLLTFRELAQHDILGRCVASQTGEGVVLAQAAFTAKGLAPADQQSILKEGDQGQPMHVFMLEPGRLLWRLAKVAPAHVPQQMTAELRDQVVRDLKLAQAMAPAGQKAESLRDAAELIGLTKAVENDANASGVDREVLTTGLFPRRQPNMSFSDVAVLPELDDPQLDEYFVRQAFELSSQSFNAATARRLPVKIIPLPARTELLVIERIGYEPATRAQFEMGRRELERLMLIQRETFLQFAWFNYNYIARRTQFQERKG